MDSSPAHSSHRRTDDCFFLPSEKAVPFDRLPAHATSVLVGDDLVYCSVADFNGGGNFFPGAWLVLGLAVEMT